MIFFAIHGYPLDHRMWEPLGELLAPAARLVAPDLRGRGRSERPALPVHSMARHADDMAEEIAALPREEPLVLAGLSMGGYVLFELLRRHRPALGDRLRAVVLCDTRATADDETGRKGREAAAAAIRETGIGAARDAMLPKLLAAGNRERLGPLVERMILETPPATACADLAGMAERADSFDVLSALDVPLLVLVGEEDAITPPANAEEMARRASPAARAHLARIRKAGHMAPLEHPEAVMAALTTLTSPA